MHKRAIITISVGKEYYQQLTKNLIRSFLIHNKSGIKLNVLTDQPIAFQEFNNYDDIIIEYLEVDFADKSFSAKFYMFEKAIAEENLFIDCDCLIYSDLNYIFEIFKEVNFGALGTMQTSGEFFCNIESIVSKFSIAALPVFVGSVYYFKKNEVAERIFQKAIELKSEYDNLGFIRLRNKENEEPLIATAMALNGETTLKNFNVKADAMFYKTIKSNVAKGTNHLVLTEKNSKATQVYSNNSASNIPIIHFNASFSDDWNYKLEAFRLKNFSNYGSFTSLVGSIFIKYPAIAKKTSKRLLRPVFRTLFGTRSVKKSNRI